MSVLSEYVEASDGFTGPPREGSQEEAQGQVVAQPKLAPLSEAPQQAELIKKPRKPRHETGSDES